MGKVNKKCEHCGASLMANEYAMNKALTGGLVKLAQNVGKPIREIGLNKSEYANISKLKHWDLAQKVADGRWFVTPLGYSFLKGEISVSKKITYFRDEVIAEEGETTIWDIVDTRESKQKYREMMIPYFEVSDVLESA